jgi:hypothetical protein
MVAVVSIDEDGAVCVTIDSEGDEDIALRGLALDDMLDRAKKTALETWMQLRTETETGE